uniref:ATP-grasp domain-containing protein n=1 Tax=Pyrodinium bahamense TaxID=73915 RepID=A0A7S0B870_9DINO|mmetsp:Transcript_54330/g.150738  ORF Transcript_54330/g.150738 Transcript_54330/m.150738 type:complete len:680 (+) Transcript_54330:76-2115(+)
MGGSASTGALPTKRRSECGGCLPCRLRWPRSTRATFQSTAYDNSPQGRKRLFSADPELLRSIDEVPSRRFPRVGSWASPAPTSPTSWGTWQHAGWQRGTSDGTDVSAASPTSQFSPHPVEFGLKIQENGTSPEHSSAAARRRRLREIGIAARQLESRERSEEQRRKASGGFRMEQLLASPGSLPRGCTAAERESAFRTLIDRVLCELTPGPTCERMGRVPRRLLTARGPDGQRLRREILRGATIVFFTAGYEGKRFVYERARALGVKSVMIESPDSWSRCLVDEGIIAKFIPVDMSQSSEAVYAQALEAIQNLSKDASIGEPDGIATVVELSVATVARLAEATGLPGPPPEAVDAARDKHRTRGILAAAGLPTPPHWAVESEADLAQAAQEVGFPAVLKPVSGAASLGVKKVESEAQLRSTYQELERELSSLVVSSGALVKDDGTGNGVNADAVISTVFLLERYLDGSEVDVDVVMSEGEWQYAAVSDNGPTLEPYFNETWAVSPSLLPRTQQVELKELAISSVKALGFTDGVFHVECKYTSIGPQLIEVNARMGGGPVYVTNLRTWCVDLVEETLFCAAGIPARPAVPRQPVECIANSDVNTLRSGKLLDLSFLDPLKGREGVISFSPHVRAGDDVVGPSDGLPTWLVEIVVSRPTPREALDFLLDLEAEVQAKVRVA